MRALFFESQGEKNTLADCALHRNYAIAIVMAPMRWWLASILVISVCGRTFAQEGEQNRHIDSRARFVHRINLWDEDGRNISMKDTEQRPYSPTVRMRMRNLAPKSKWCADGCRN